MVSGSLKLVQSLIERAVIATHAAKNLDYMHTLYHDDNTLKEYFDKAQRMANELPHLLWRVSELKQILEEYNRIALK